MYSPLRNEERIAMAIVVDRCTKTEAWPGWLYHLVFRTVRDSYRPQMNYNAVIRSFLVKSRGEPEFGFERLEGRLGNSSITFGERLMGGTQITRRVLSSEGHRDWPQI